MPKASATTAIPVPRIFVSATSGDLGTVRRAVANGLRGVGALAVEQEYFAPPGRSIRDMLEEKILGCQAVIHIAGTRYGAEDKADPHALAGHTYAEGRRSYSQLEHDLALAHGKRLYVFVCAEDFPFDDCAKEPPELAQCQRDHRARLGCGSHFRSRVSSPNDLLGHIGRLEDQVRALSRELMVIGERMDTLSGSLKRYLGIGAIAAALIAGGIWALARRGREVQKTVEETSLAVKDVLAENRAIVARLASLYNESSDLKESLTDAQKFERAVQRIAEAEKLTKGDVLARVDSFVAGVRAREKQGRADFYDLGLAAFAEKNFAKAAGFAEQAAAAAREERLAAGKALAEASAKVRTAGEAERKAEKLAGDAEAAAYHYDKAAAHYRAAAALFDLDHEPEAWVAAHKALVVALKDAGKCAEGLPVAQKLSDASRSKLGADSPDAFSADILLASMIAEAGDATKAEAMMVATHERASRVLGESHELTLSAGNNLGLLFSETGKLAKAEQLLTLVSNTEGSNVLTAGNNLATVLLEKGDLNEAEHLLVLIRAKRLEFNGKDHPITLAVGNQLGLVYLAKNETDKALARFSEDRDTALKSLGENHPSLYTTIHNLGLAWEQKGDAAQAEQHYLRAIAGIEKTLGETHASTLKSMRTLADFHLNRRQYHQARAVLEKMLPRYEQAFGRDDVRSLECCAILGICCEADDDEESSKKYLLRALEGDERRMASPSQSASGPAGGGFASLLDKLYFFGWFARQDTLGKEHPDTLRTLGRLADIYKQQRRYPAAAEHYERLLEAQERVSGKDDPGALATACKLGTVYLRLKKPEKAAPLLERVLETRLRTLGKYHLDTTKAMRELAVLRLIQKDAPGAEKLLTDAAQASVRAVGLDDPRTLEARQEQADFYRYQKQPGRARELLETLLADRTRVLGPRHAQTQETAESLASVYLALSLPEKAEPLILGSLALFEDQLTEDLHCAPALISALGAHYQSGNSGAKALDLQGRLLTATRRVFGTDHTLSLAAMASLADAEERNGKTQEALGHLSTRAERTSAKFGESSPETFAALSDVAGFHTRMKALDKAEQVYLPMLALQESKLGKEHPSTLTTLNGLAVVYDRKREYLKAQALLERAFTARERVLGSKHKDTFLSAYNLASNYKIQGIHPDKATLLARQAYEGWLQSLGPDHSNTKIAKTLLLSLAPAP